MKISRNHNDVFNSKLSSINLQKMEKFKFLGTVIDSSGKIQTESSKGIEKSVCVSVPTHCTITCFGFHARWIDGVECGLFLNQAPLGQTTLRVE